MIKITELFDLSKTIAEGLFKGKTYPWEVLDEIDSFILSLGPTLPTEEFNNPCEGVWIAKDAKIAATASIGGPCIIDHKAELRHCAFIRSGAIIGKNAVVGNSVELKAAVLFDNVQVPHHTYVGLSILGYKAHMGAGAQVSNLKSDQSNVVVKCGDEDFVTGRRKLGTMLGDYVEVGCNAVLNPGSIVCRNSNVYPLASVRGTVPPSSIYKSRTDIVKKR